MGTASDIRERIGRGETINMPGCYDALSARLATEAGFEVLFISGYSVAASRLGLPDYGYLTQTEITEAARSVCNNTDCPVIVDADTGYGNPLNALRTARLLTHAGASGVFLEDQTWPKKCGHFADKKVVDRAEWLAKLQAIIDLREEEIDLFVVARTDARGAVSLDEAIARARAARDLGVDAIFVEAPESIAELKRVSREVEGVVRVANMIEGGRTPLLGLQELHELGYDLVVTPLSALLAAARTLREIYSLLRKEGTLGEHMEKLIAFSDFSPIVALEAHRKLEERYKVHFSES